MAAKRHLKQWTLKSIIGPLHLVASESGLRGIYWKRQSVPSVKSLAGSAPEIRILARAAGQLSEYFEGKRESFDLPFDVEGTPFQMRVWKTLAKIPYGKTLSYREVARRIRSAKAFRAVGTANGKNPLSIVVPCHRVIAADGSLGGYAGGLATKSKLLELESKI